MEVYKKINIRILIIISTNNGPATNAIGNKDNNNKEKLILGNFEMIILIINKLQSSIYKLKINKLNDTYWIF